MNISKGDKISTGTLENIGFRIESQSKNRIHYTMNAPSPPKDFLKGVRERYIFNSKGEMTYNSRAIAKQPFRITARKLGGGKILIEKVTGIHNNLTIGLGWKDFKGSGGSSFHSKEKAKLYR